MADADATDDDDALPPGVPAVPGRPEERELVARLLAGDEATFATLLDRYNGTMLRVARGFLSSRSVAEEVVQETWLAILEALPRFQGRSSLKTWMFRILTNRAKTRARREGRVVPMSALGPLDDDGEPGVDADRFHENGMWKAPPGSWNTPEKGVIDTELGERIEQAIETLPERQRLVITLRDVQGWSSAEVCNVLEISETNQRVLLHRGRSKVRAILADYLEAPPR